MIGTAEYMPPEAYLKRATDKIFAFDMWSLGCLFYELVVGNPPFSGSPGSLRQTVIRKEYANKDYFSKSFSKMLEGLLEKDVNQRLTL